MQLHAIFVNDFSILRYFQLHELRTIILPLPMKISFDLGIKMNEYVRFIRMRLMHIALMKYRFVELYFS